MSSTQGSPRDNQRLQFLSGGGVIEYISFGKEAVIFALNHNQRDYYEVDIILDFSVSTKRSKAIDVVLDVLDRDSG